MPDKKAFKTKYFRLLLRRAINKMHRTVNDIERIYRATDNLEEIQEKVISECIGPMQAALEAAKFHGNDWLSEMHECSL